MEYADQGDLFQLITEHKKTKKHFTEEEIWSALIQLLNGLKSLHELNILHRDLKSANVFLFKGGIVKLGDLNVSKITRKGMGYTQTGTPYYASPEVWKDKPYDSKSDIWSLGCVIYEMCALNPPFRAQNMEELFKKVIRGYYPDISNRYSKDLSEILKLMIQTEVGARPSCDELLIMPIIKNRSDFFNNKNNLGKEKDESNLSNKELLSTIRIPKNINNLSRNLPKPNYVSNSFELENNSNINSNEATINNINKFGYLNMNKKDNILLNKINININKRINQFNNISSLSKKNMPIKYKLNNKLEDIYLKNNNLEKPLKMGINNNSINKGINYYKKNIVFSPKGRLLNNKNNISLGGKVILPELKLRNKNINLIRNISIVNNNINKDSNRLIKIKNNNNKLSNNHSYKDLNIRDNYKQLNENYDQRKSDNYNYQNLKVVNLNIIDPKKVNIKKSLFRIGSPISLNRNINYINNEKILKNENKYGYCNNKKYGSLPKKNIILNINL
jgi:serine/threonine protein kinase